MTDNATSFFGHCPLPNTLLPVIGLPGNCDLHRVYAPPGSDWETAPPQYRFGRVDPPSAHKSAYSVIYLADSKRAAEFEARRVQATFNEGGEEVVRQLWHPGRDYRHACHRTRRPLLLVDLDSPVLAAKLRDPGGGDCLELWRECAWEVLQLLREFGSESFLPIVGLTYRSRQRLCAGQVVAIYDEFKSASLFRGADGSLAT